MLWKKHINFCFTFLLIFYIINIQFNAKAITKDNAVRTEFLRELSVGVRK